MLHTNIRNLILYWMPIKYVKFITKLFDTHMTCFASGVIIWRKGVYMRIGIIGPQATVDEVLTAVSTSGLFVECVPLVYSSYKETVELVERNENNVDGFLFTGTTPFRYASKYLSPKQQWEYLPRNTTSFLCALLKAAYINNYGISSISVDSYDELFIRKAYAEIGLTGEDIKIIESPYNIFNEDYEMKVAEFHYDNFKSGRSNVCVTGLKSIQELLKKKNVPVVKLSPTAELIIQQINKMRLLHKLTLSEKNIVAVIAFSVSFEIENSYYGKSELHMFMSRNKVTEIIYAFAQRIGAAVETHENGVYHAYTTKDVVETETNGFSSFNILHSIGIINGVKSVSIGIGLGKTSLDAKYNAKIGQSRAEKCGINCFFIVKDDHEVVGPITDVGEKTDEKVLDKHLYEISRRTGIGMNKLYKLERAVRKYGSNVFISKDLARECNMTHNSMNRLLLKLEESGYAKVVGKQPTSNTGRPSRLIRLNFGYLE